MKDQPVLVIMAAGMGSRFGGLKQIKPVGPNGETILDYSLYDARRAGFERAVIVVKRENERDFRELMGDRVARHMRVDYAYQDADDLPPGFAVPKSRRKPWGTGHAVLAARKLVDAPFCAVNADDFYGAEAFRLCYEHLSALRGDGDLMMVGYLLRNTLSPTGYVARGVCDVAPDGLLRGIREHTHIIPSVDGPLTTEDGESYRRLSPDTVVSMNMWGFPARVMDDLWRSFPRFLADALERDPDRAEFFLPMVVGELLAAGRATVTVRTTPDRWYGVTYREDSDTVSAALKRMADAGAYPAPLWAEG